jgi:hypothetical protein
MRQGYGSYSTVYNRIIGIVIVNLKAVGMGLAAYAGTLRYTQIHSETQQCRTGLPVGGSGYSSSQSYSQSPGVVYNSTRSERYE